jgi:uncharacterized protein (DUF433 family)
MRNSRVTLHTVITDFNQGNAPEEIVHSFPTLNVADVYAVISYYLNYQDEIDAYLREEEDRAEAVRLDLEAKHPELFTLQKRLRELVSQKA